MGAIFYRWIIQPILFRFDAESVHHAVIGAAAWLWRWRWGRIATKLVYCSSRTITHPLRLAGLDLRNPIGLAAGFDKNGTLVSGIACLGFGFAEIGTVTPLPQAGNPRPRLERLPAQNAILNRMGFNNDGMVAVAERLRQARPHLEIPVGVNLGKNKDTSNEDAVGDYEKLLKCFAMLADYFVINISSPNTPGLRDLQSGEFLKNLGAAVTRLRVTQPVFIKLSPTVSDIDLRAACALCSPPRVTGAAKATQPFAGLVLTNTIPTDLGGISGQPLRAPSVAVLRQARGLLASEVPLISVGGISGVSELRQRLDAGATAVQIYTALVYEGPGLISRMVKGL